MSEGLDVAAVDRLLEDIDRRIQRQLDCILAHPAVASLTGLWCALADLVDRLEPDDSVRLAILPCSKEALAAELGRAGPELTLGKLLTRDVASSREPIAAVLGAYELTGVPDDMTLLRSAARATRIIAAPFITAVGPAFVGADRFSSATPSDVSAWLDAPDRHRYRELRELPESFNLVLVAGAVAVGCGDRSVVANPVSLLALQLATSFRRYGWGANVGGMPTPTPPMAIADVLSPAKQRALAARGIVALVGDESAARCVDALVVHDAVPDDDNHVLGARFVLWRFLHFLLVIHSDLAARCLPVEDMERALDCWLAQYVHGAEVRTDDSRRKKPLNQGRVRVLGDGAQLLVTLEFHGDTWGQFFYQPFHGRQLLGAVVPVLGG